MTEDSGYKSPLLAEAKMADMTEITENRLHTSRSDGRTLFDEGHRSGEFHPGDHQRRVLDAIADFHRGRRRRQGGG